MELKKLVPWNWFKKEEERNLTIPIRHAEMQHAPFFPRTYTPMMQLQREIDHLLNNFFRDFDLPTMGSFNTLMPLDDAGLLKPRVDLSANDHEYQLTLEIPGVTEKDVSLSVSGNTLTIKGEKKQEKEEKDKEFYRIERNYGSFQRVLSLPEDVDQDGVKATFKNGVLIVTMARKAIAKSDAKQIEITSPS